MKKLAVGILISCLSVMVLANEPISKSNISAKDAANCAANIFATGQLKILFNQQRDAESENMVMGIGPAMLYLSALYSSRDEAFEVFDKRQKVITENMFKSVGDGSSRKAIADFILRDLVPYNEKCIPVIKDYKSKNTILMKYMNTPEGKVLMDQVTDKLLEDLKKNK